MQSKIVTDQSNFRGAEVFCKSETQLLQPSVTLATPHVAPSEPESHGVNNIDVSTVLKVAEALPIDDVTA